MTTPLTAEALHRLTTHKLLQLFATLDAPDLSEMDGEYRARLLAQPTWLAGIAGRMTLTNPFRRWQGKAFRAVDHESGRGYNTFLQGGRTIQRYPMLTLRAPSRFDGRPAYQLVYRYFESLCGDINMVDEVRRVAPGLYLGIGTWGFTPAQRQTPLPFLLEGPVAPYRGSVGRLRKHFVIGSRELPATSGASS